MNIDCSQTVWKRVPYLLFIKLITHRCISHAYCCVSMDNQCVPKWNVTSQNLGLSRELKQYQKRHNRNEQRQRGGEKKTYNAQASSTAAAQFWNPHHLVTSFLCCTELQILSAQKHTHTCAHTHTHCTLCAHTCSIRQGLCLSKKVTQEICGGRVCVLLEVCQRPTERERKREIHNGLHLNYISPAWLMLYFLFRNTHN